LFLSSHYSFANEPVDVAKKMQRLSLLEGLWTMTVEFTPDKGQTWNTMPSVEVDVSFGHKNRLMREIPINPSEQGFNMETYLSFDQYRNVYRKAAIDDAWGIMDIYEGSIKDSYLIMTNLKSGTTFPVSDGKWRAFRLSIQLASPQRKMIIDASDDNGQTWHPSFIVTYQLKK